MSFQLTGKLVQISDTQQVNERFKKREFVVETTEVINGNHYSDFAKFQTVQNKCDLLDRFAVGTEVTVHFNVKGNKWEKDGKVNYITNLDAWRIEGGHMAGATGRNDMTEQNFPNTSTNDNPYGYDLKPTGAVDDLPF